MNSRRLSHISSADVQERLRSTSTRFRDKLCNEPNSPQHTYLYNCRCMHACRLSRRRVRYFPEDESFLIMDRTPLSGAPIASAHVHTLHAYAAALDVSLSRYPYSMHVRSRSAFSHRSSRSKTFQKVRSYRLVSSVRYRSGTVSSSSLTRRGPIYA